MSKKPIPRKKIFFITSNLLNQTEQLQYELQKCIGIQNLRAREKGEFIQEIKYLNNKYLTTLCSFEIIPSDLKKENKPYKATIVLRDIKNYYFKGNIIFTNYNKNIFIYDFKFEDYKGMIKDYPPPISIKFTKCEQLKFFLNYLKQNKILINEELGIDLIQDSLNYITNDNFALDFYMEIFKACYSQKNIISFLNEFSLEKFYIPLNFNYQEYSSIINLIYQKPRIIMRHLNEKDEHNIYYIKLYTLIFYLRRKYDKENAEKMILNKDLYKYFADFLPKYPNYFANLICPEELIDQMFKVGLTLNIIKGAFIYASGVEQILYFIIKYINEIKNCILNEKNILIMSRIGLAQENDDLDKIYEYIFKIIKYEIENNKEILFSFDKTFWESYIILFNDIKKLEIIKRAIKICSELEKDLSSENFGLNEKIHNLGILSIEKGLLKNESLLDFIKNDDYFSDRDKEKKFYRPLSILKGLDFETMTDNFFEKWKTSNIFIIYNFDITNFKSALINSIDDIKYFGKLLKLFDYKNNKIFDNHVLTNLRAKFKNIVIKFKKETCPDFVKDVAFYIYIMDFVDKKNIQSFLKDTIEKYIVSSEIIRDIYLYLVTQYKDISENAIESVTTYLMNNKERLNAEAIIFLLEKITNLNIIKFLLNKLINFVIKEEELYSQENNFESFKLLELIQKKNLMDKCQGTKGTQYLLNTIALGDKVLNDIKNGQITYNSFMNIGRTFELRNNFKNKLNLLFFNNEKDVNTCIDILINYLRDIAKIIGNIKRILSVFELFYKITLKDEISQIKILKNELQSGMICEFSKKELIDIINSFKEKVNDFNSQYTLTQSIFFTHFFNNFKKKNIEKKETEIFKDTLKQFTQLRYFFTDDWIANIPFSIIKECFRALRVNPSKQNIEDRILKELLKEIEIIAKYFNIEKPDNDYLTLAGRLIIYKEEEDIFITSKGCVHLIEELDAKSTEFYNDLKKIKTGIKKSIHLLDDMRRYGETLKKYGLNIIDSEDKNNDYLDILEIIAEKENLIPMLIKTKQDDIPFIEDQCINKAINLTKNDIQSMIKCANFIHQLCNEKDKKTDSELIKGFINLVLEPINKDIKECFNILFSKSEEFEKLCKPEFEKLCKYIK